MPRASTGQAGLLGIGRGISAVMGARSAACPRVAFTRGWHAERVTDLDAWVDRVRHSTSQLLERFEERFGYPPDLNFVATTPGRDGTRLSGAVEPDAVVPLSVVEFFNAIEEVSLPDVWNGYFLGPVRRVIDPYTNGAPRWLMLDGRQIEILVIGFRWWRRTLRCGT